MDERPTYIPETQSESSAGSRRTPKSIRLAFVSMVSVVLIGCFFTRQIKLIGLHRRELYRENVFWYLYAEHEPFFFGLTIVTIVLSYLYFRWSFSFLTVSGLQQSWAKRCHVFMIAGGVFLVTAVGTYFVFHDFPVCNDEFMAAYQASIFAAGRIFATVPPEWREFALPLTPIFAVYNPDRHTWISAYLPVYSAIRALFHLGAVESLTNPFLAALSILGLAGVARNLWPGSREHVVVAVALLASSSQFLLMSMTAFAMSAHLCLNLLWLWLYTQRSRFGWVLTPWVGVLALGLHNPGVHALFVAPFLVRLLRNERRSISAYFASVYLIGSAFWLFWMTKVTQGIVSGGGEQTTASVFGFPGPSEVVANIMHLSMLVSWQAFPLIFFSLIAIGPGHSLPPVFKDLIWSFILTYGFYWFFLPGQSHGWGYRYCYSVLGNLALLGVVGWQEIIRWAGGRKALSFLLGTCTLALVVGLPVRCSQAEKFVRPYFLSVEYIKSLPVPLVVFDARTVWSPRDFSRNDPFLKSNPKLFYSDRLTQAQRTRLHQLGDVQIVGGEQLSQFGMPKTQTVKRNEKGSGDC